MPLTLDQLLDGLGVTLAAPPTASKRRGTDHSKAWLVYTSDAAGE
ncbi:hypothetical protein [Deinococcus sp. ME38]